MAELPLLRGVVPSSAPVHRSSLVVSAILGVLVSLLLLAGYRVILHPLAHIPGPFLAKFSGLWRDWRYLRGSWHDDILQVHRKYGRIVRIAPNEVSIVDADAVKRLYGHGHFAPKTNWYAVFDQPVSGASLFSARDRDRHGYLRKRVAGAYSMTSILKYEPYIQKCLTLLLDKLREHCANGPVDMSTWTNAFTYDIVGELGYGTDLGMLQDEIDTSNLRSEMFDVFKLFSCLGHFPGQSWILTNPMSGALFKLLGMEEPMNAFRTWTIGRVKNRLDDIENVKRDDMWQHFCKMQDMDGEPVGVMDIVVEAMSLIGAGADTTSIAMRSCLFYLASNTQCTEKLREEIDSHYEDNKLEGPLSYLQAQKMPYLQAVVSEATRLLPSIVAQLPRYAPANFTVRGMHNPEGTTVGISAIAQNRDSEIFGPDPDDFRPERWLEGESEVRLMEASIMTYGGNGSRMCLGRNIALVELHKFLGQFVHEFDFEFADEMKPWNITSYMFAFQHDLIMNLKARNTGTSQAA